MDPNLGSCSMAVAAEWVPVERIWSTSGAICAHRMPIRRKRRLPGGLRGQCECELELRGGRASRKSEANVSGCVILQSAAAVMMQQQHQRELSALSLYQPALPSLACPGARAGSRRVPVWRSPRLYHMSTEFTHQKVQGIHFCWAWDHGIFLLKVCVLITFLFCIMNWI